MAKPDFESLNKAMGEAYRLARSGELTSERLDEIEAAAEEAAGDYGEWREAMTRYRLGLEVAPSED
jgi:phage terminase Nu1 subunit (DNA packaging protein)